MTQRTDTLMHDLCRYIESHSDEPLPLARLAEQAHLSPTHLQKRFKAAIGVTPKAYHAACRLKRLKEHLHRDAPVTSALYEAGFGSPSRLYERTHAQIGMTPAQYRARGESLAISYASTSAFISAARNARLRHGTPLGLMLLAATDRGLCFLQFGDSEPELLATLASEFPRAHLTPMPPESAPAFSRWMESLTAYLNGDTRALHLPLDIRGTAFQQKVWRYLQTIPAGETRSYAEVAAAIGHPKAARAVGTACGKNRLAIAIPCHRVLRGDGDLAGYRWGLERKRALLEQESAL